jgi:hypothetical protein
MPKINRPIVGRNTLTTPIVFVCFPIAGEKKPNISLTMVGIEPVIPISTDT